VSKPKKLRNIDVRPGSDQPYRVRVKPFRAAQFTREADAIAHRDKLLRARQTGVIADPDADLITVRELGAEWSASAELEDRTVKTYTSMWKHVQASDFIDMPIRMVTPAMVEDWRDEMLSGGTGTEAVRKAMALLQTVMKRGERYGKTNPCLVVDKPKQSRKRTITVISPRQVEDLRRQLQGADAVLVSVLAYTGMRPEEALALTWGDVQARTIIVDKAVDPDGTIKATKTRRNRTVRLLGPLADDLKAFRVASGNPKDSAFIFPREDGKAWKETDYRNWRNRKFKKAATDAGVNITRPYDLRHSAASLWLHELVSPNRVAKWMGHSLATLSKDYDHIIEDVDEDDPRSAEQMIRDARQDNARTKLRVLKSQDQSAA
jgi:integrase